MTTNTIARQAGIPEATLRDFVKGRTQRIRRPHALKVMGVTPASLDLLAWHQPLAAERRVRALYAVGHSSEDIAAAAGLARSVVSAIAHGHKTRLSGRTVQAIRNAYPLLAKTTGTSRVALRAARKAGWLGPGYYDDDEIDNPDYEPAVTHTPRYIALAEDCAELERLGHTREQIAARLGVTRDGLQRALSLYRKAGLGEAA
ncbi:helix-turn-helix domain-containing protein [Streptomyces sp. NPDC127069]|uniref:helix-turn-helix domain-containing protein n=1 Tax=Streptomyces sp. NPDC127069 TaxID=3347128 RepID=UPI003661A839